MKRIAVVRLLFIMLATLVSQWPCIASAESDVLPPPKIPSMNHLPSTLSAPPASKIIFGELIVEFERTTLNEVEKAAGAGVIQHRGDAGDSENWLCYRTSLHGRQEHIWISSGELGGSKHTVGSVYASTVDRVKKSVDCPILPAQLRPVSLGNQLWLGSSPDQLKEILGAPSAKNGDWLLYSYIGKASANGLDRLAILGVRFRDGRAVDLFISQATTN
jgi:hypothetical protein